MFLPDYLMGHFAVASKKANNEAIVQKVHPVYEAPDMAYHSLKFISPFVVFLVLTLLVLWFSVKQFRRGTMNVAMDYWVYGLNGLMGVVMAWFVLFSEHPAMRPNFNLLWGIPLNFLFLFALMVKKWRPVLEYYHVFISAWLLLFICLSPFIPQYFHPVFYLFVLMILSRSIFPSLLLYRKRRPINKNAV
jgi:hypothetical protein